MPAFHTTERLGAVQSATPEGFLICEAVPVSRTGILLYAPGELPIPAGPDGLIRVHRSEDAVFEPASIQSFEGKSLVDLHPGQDVTPENWRRFAVGHMQNVRRGVGDQAHLLLADLVVKDAAAIREIKAGKRHVSLGYDARYTVFAPGNAQQKNIRGNHVALVPEGRCGVQCSIGDAVMTTPTQRTWIDRLRSAFQVQDETMFAAALAEAPTPGTAVAAPAGPAPVFNIVTGDKATDQTAEFARTTADALTKLNDTVKGLSARLDGLDDKIKARDAKAEEDAKAAKAEREADEAKRVKEAKERDEAKALDDAKAAAAKDKDAKVAEAKEAEAKTGDSAGLASVFQDTLSRAESLIPGVALPTFDAAASPKATEDTLCGFRRRVLIAAQTSGAGREHVEAMMPAGGDLTAMSCDAVGTTFQAATELARQVNNRASPGVAGVSRAKPTGKVGPLSPAEINARNAAYYYPNAKK